jgi:hypothetical protein
MATTVAASPAVVTGLANGSSYYFTVTARNSVGSGPSANSNTVIPSGLAAPTNLHATSIRSTSIDVAWNAVSGATGYEIVVV